MASRTALSLLSRPRIHRIHAPKVATRTMSSSSSSAIPDPPSAGPSSTGPQPPPPTSRFTLPGPTPSTTRPDNSAMLQSVSRDFRSDTVTIPTDRMFTEMALASRGDDVFREDVTTSSFEEAIARLTGKESALFVVSGTASNQLALRTHLAGCVPPSSVLMDSRAHIHTSEAGALAMISQATTLAIKPKNGRHLTWSEDVQPNLVPDDGNIHYCPTRVVALENTLWGTVFPQAEVEKISKECKERGVIMHLDGARLWNVSAKMGKTMEELCRPFDTVSLCLSKGLGAPVGSILVGPTAFTTRARHFRKLLGGGVRQIGPLVAAARVAVEDHFPKLAHTHALASWMATQLSQLGVLLTEGGEPETNMLFIDPTPLGFTNDELNARLTTKEGIKAWAPRIVVHHQIEAEAVRRFVEVVREMKEEVRRDGRVKEAGPYKKKGGY